MDVIYAYTLETRRLESAVVVWYQHGRPAETPSGGPRLEPPDKLPPASD